MLRVRVFVAASLSALVFPALASAQTTTFSSTAGEQTYTVPAGVLALSVTAIGAAGGGPTTCCLAAGRGAIVTGTVAVSPGQTLYVEVGGTGAQSVGGFNGGGDSPIRNGLSVFGGGGASDLRTISRANSGSLASRLIVAAGGGGSGSPAARGGDAGAAGGSSPGSSVGGGAGTQTAGGAGGCNQLLVGCGADGALGIGGAGGSSGDGAQTREGAGGGGGLYGGGGGAGVLDGSVGGGGGGSSLVPAGGSLSLALFTQPPSVVISTRVPAQKYLAYEIPVYSCVAGPFTPAGTNIANVSYVDKGDGDVHLEDVQPIAIPDIANWQIREALDGTPFATYFESAAGTRPAIELKGSAVPAIQNAPPVVDVLALQSPPFNLPPGFRIASSTCSPAP